MLTCRGGKKGIPTKNENDNTDALFKFYSIKYCLKNKITAIMQFLRNAVANVFIWSRKKKNGKILVTYNLVYLP